MYSSVPSTPVKSFSWSLRKPAMKSSIDTDCNIFCDEVGAAIRAILLGQNAHSRPSVADSARELHGGRSQFSENLCFPRRRRKSICATLRFQAYNGRKKHLLAKGAVKSWALEFPMKSRAFAAMIA